MANHEVKFKRALPNETQRKKRITFRTMSYPQGAEFAIAMTNTDFKPYQLRFAGEAHAGYVSEGAPSLTLRPELIEELAKRVVIYLSHNPSHHLEIIIGFADAENEKHQEKLKQMIMQAILAFNTHEITKSDILKIYIFNTYMHLLKKLALLSPQLITKNK